MDKNKKRYLNNNLYFIKNIKTKYYKVKNL